MEGVETARGTWLEQARKRFTPLLGPYALPLTLSWIVLSAIVALVSFVFYMTFVPGLPFEPGLTLSHWTNAFRPYVLNKVIPNTIIVGFGATLVTLFFACPLAFLLNRTALPFRNLFMTLIAVVVIIPGFVKTMGWIMLVNERIGLINNAIAGLLGLDSLPFSLNNPYGIAWVMGLILTPTMFFLISGPMRALDPALEDVAGVSGANRWWTFLRISLPLMWPGILGGAIYIFMTAISIFEVPAMLGAAGGKAPVLSSELFYAVRPTVPDSMDVKYGAAGVYATMIAAPSLVALYFYHQVLAKAHRYGVITGKGYRPRDIELGRFKYLGFGFIVLYLLLAVVLPMLVLTWMSFLPLIQMPSVKALSKLSLENYRSFMEFIGGQDVMRNTAVLLFSVSLLAIFFSLMISWIVVRTRLRVRHTMDTIAMLPHAFPGLAFAFALFILGILASVWFPSIPVSGTLGIIVLANLLNRLSYTTRITNAALLQVTPELEESARVCGAGDIPTMWSIIMPLVRPSLVFAGLWTALLTFREVSMALFLTETNNVVLSVAVWELWDSGQLGEASAAAVVMVSAMGLLLLATLAITGGRLIHRSGF